jgi:hypothetical protein
MSMTGDCIDERWYIYTASLKSNEIQIHTAPWVNLENILLSEIHLDTVPYDLLR